MDSSHYNYYKYCRVPQCTSTSIKTPNKLFIYVPHNKNIRQKWLHLAGRTDAHTLSTKTRMYFCEDHFDLPNDMANYMEYSIMGTVTQVRMKQGCLPSKFECKEVGPKRICSTEEQPHMLIKQRIMTIKDSLNTQNESNNSVSSHVTSNKSSKSTPDTAQHDDEEDIDTKPIDIAIVKIESSADEEIFEVCRICLATDVKMYHISKYDLEQTYRQVTGILADDVRLPQHICWECSTRLTQAHALRTKALHNDTILHELLLQHGNINISDIKTIDRKQNGLETSLKQVLVNFEHDTQLTSENTDIEDDFTNKTDDLETLQDNIEIKEEEEEILLPLDVIESNEIDALDINDIKTEVDVIESETTEFHIENYGGDIPFKEKDEFDKEISESSNENDVMDVEKEKIRHFEDKDSTSEIGQEKEGKIAMKRNCKEIKATVSKRKRVREEKQTPNTISETTSSLQSEENASSSQPVPVKANILKKPIILRGGKSTKK